MTTEPEIPAYMKGRSFTDSALLCPVCQSSLSTVYDTRHGATQSIRRRRMCDQGHRYTTREMHEVEAKEYGVTVNSADLFDINSAITSLITLRERLLNGTNR